MLDKLWGEAVVTDDAVTQCIVDIRRVIGDKQQTIILTVPKRGYRLDTPVISSATAATISPNTATGNSSKIVSAILALFALAVIGIFLWSQFGPPPARSELSATTSPSIAVLPFMDMSDKKNLQYFSDGISEEILNSLVQTNQLQVTARTSSFSFRDTDASIKTIAEALNVQYVLEGSVRESGNQIRITAQLIDAKDETHLWSTSYDRELDDLFAVQYEIADTVLTKLEGTLDFERPQRNEANPEAYRLYLQAKYRIDNADDQNADKTRQLLRQSLELDSAFAPAWRELARLHWRSVSASRATEDIAILEAMLDRALELDPRDPGTLAYQGWHAADFYLDMQSAAQFFQLAFDAGPNDENLVRTASLFSLAVGASEKAVEIAEHGVKSNPLCRHCLHNLIAAYLNSGDLEEAEKTARRFSTVFGGGHSSRGVALLRMGRAEEALVEFTKEAYEPYHLYGRAISMHTLEAHSERDKSLSELKSYQDSNPWLLINAYAWMEQTDLAFAAIARTSQENRSQVAGKTVIWGGVKTAIALHDPMLNSLHHDSRWQSVLEQYKISDAQLAAIQLGMFTVGTDSANR